MFCSAMYHSLSLFTHLSFGLIGLHFSESTMQHFASPPLVVWLCDKSNMYSWSNSSVVPGFPQPYSKYKVADLFPWREVCRSDKMGRSLEMTGMNVGCLIRRYNICRCMFSSPGADDICDYFGVKISMYFAWLGFYTNSMLYPAVIGFLLWILAEADQVP